MRRATLFLVILLLGCNAASNPGGWAKYNDPEAGFALTYPARWKQSSTPMPHASLLVKGKGDDKGLSCSMYHQRFDNLTDVVPETALENINPKVIEATLSGHFRDVTLGEPERTTLSGLPANRYTVTYQLPKLGGRSEPYMGEVLVAAENGGIYNFFCGAPVTRYSVEGARFDRIRRSIMIIPSSRYTAPYQG